jgi:hypothetical protein
LPTLALLLPDQRALWLPLHGTRAAAALVDEDATGLTVLTPRERGGWTFWVNGYDHSRIPYRGIHSVLGALPVLAHPHPRAVAVIGLGSGDTAWAAGCRREVERIAVYEIVAGQLRVLRELDRRGGYPPLRRLLADPRVTVTVQDGRHALRHAPGALDVIEIDALEPFRAMAGNVSSAEFYRLCASRLRPDGLLCAWTPTDRMLRTLRSAFPHVWEPAGMPVALASRSPLQGAPEEWARRLDSEQVSGYLGRQVATQLRNLLSRSDGQRGLPESTQGLNLDLFPRDEFMSR